MIISDIGDTAATDTSASSSETNVSNWSNLSEIRVEDETCASFSNVGSAEFTCRFTDFNIPSNAIITGIKLTLIYNTEIGVDVTAKIRDQALEERSD